MTIKPKELNEQGLIDLAGSRAVGPAESSPGRRRLVSICTS